jgi:hypothetical protein
VTPTGSKLWRYRYRFNGSAKMLALGPYPAVTLLKARQLRDAARQLLIEGTDPGEQKKTAKQAQKVEGLTFETLAREWFAYNAPRWAESTTYKAKLYLENDLIPGIGARPLKAITRPDLVELVRKVEARGTLNATGKIRQWLHQIFRYGLAKGVVDANPATDLSVVAAPPKAARHHPHVTFAELPELLAKSEAANIHSLKPPAMSDSDTNHIQGFDTGDWLIFTQISTKPMIRGANMTWERRHDPEEYVSIIAEVFYDPARRKNGVRPASGQLFAQTMKIECSREIRDYPVGTQVRLLVVETAKEDSRPFLYSSYKWAHELA